jgi:cysteine-rich repeat protein
VRGVGPISLLALTLALGCVERSAQLCDGNKLCPGGMSCLAYGGDQLCVTDEQLAACQGAAEGDACTLGAGAGTCYGGACLPAACGNGRRDAGELCDDHNNVVGDGCSADCRSTETCGNGLVDPLVLTATGSAPNEACDDGNRIGHDGCDSQCRVESPRWDVVTYEPVTDRFEHAMMFDASREQVVVFGGATYGGGLDDIGLFTGDTIELATNQWAHRTSLLQPAPRLSHAMAYDARRERGVLFGGNNNGTLSFADTWEWDGTRWDLAGGQVAPPARSNHAMAYDADRGVVVLFGGRSSIMPPYHADTWEWDGTRWQQRTDVGAPPARFRHAMAYDPARKVIVMSGGFPQVGETWELDGQGWRDVTPPSGPRPLMLNGAMAYDTVDQRMIAYGGSDVSRETWAWDGATWTALSAVAGLGPRKSIRAATDATGRMIVQGGLIYTGTTPGLPVADTWRWNGTAWDQVVAPRPGVRSGFAAYDRDRARVVVFGGADTETWELDRGGWRRVISAMSPPFRQSHAMAYDAARRRMVLFGGGTDTSTWTLDGDQWSVAATTGPPLSTYQPAMTFDDAHAQIVMFGGQQSDGAFSDETWLWGGTSWTRATPTIKPPGRWGHAIAYDPIRRRVLLFGGAVLSGSPMDDTWEWDGTDWTQLHPATKPLARANHGMAWDAARGRIVLAGGVTGATDVWEWDGTDWRPVLAPTPPPPTARLRMVPALDGAGVLVLDTNGTVTVARRLRWSGEATYEACTGGDHDADGLVGCADRDCWPTCSPACPPGVSCMTTGPFTCGDGTCDPNLESCSSCAADCTCTPQCGDFRCDPGETCPGDC